MVLADRGSIGLLRTGRLVCYSAASRPRMQVVESAAINENLQIVVAGNPITPYIYLTAYSEINEDSHFTHASSRC